MDLKTCLEGSTLDANRIKFFYRIVLAWQRLKNLVDRKKTASLQYRSFEWKFITPSSFSKNNNSVVETVSKIRGPTVINDKNFTCNQIFAKILLTTGIRFHPSSSNAVFRTNLLTRISVDASWLFWKMKFTDEMKRLCKLKFEIL